MLSIFIFEFQITALQQMELQGPSLRGGLGSALKDLLCTTDMSDCSRCPLVSQCAFTRIWQGADGRSSAHFKNQDSLPRPFVLTVPPQLLEPGDHGTFRLGLFGTGVSYIAHFISACALLANTGLSRKRKRFLLDQVNSIDPHGSNPAITVYERSSTQTSDRFHSTCLASTQAIKTAERIRISLHTPTQISCAERIVDRAPTFEEVMRALLRRYCDLSELYGSGRPELEFESMISYASQISMVGSEIQTNKSKTFSKRKNSPTPIAGITGWIDFEGDLARYLALLTFGQWLHIGKQTTFGLGHYSTRLAYPAV